MKSKGISSGTLKLLAVLFMLLDHIGIIFFEIPSPLGNTNLGEMLDVPLRAVGRIAFPLFLFCLAEGFKHTHDKLKYVGRLFLFALISEIPYDFGNSGVAFDWENNNVMWTMLSVFIMYMALDKAKAIATNHTMLFAYSGIIVSLTCLAAYFGRVDYGVPAICAALVFYLAKNKTKGYLGAVFVLSLLFSPVEALALPGAFLIHKYNGSKGRQMKYFFYAFYPLHFIVLRLLYIVIFGAGS